MFSKALIELGNNYAIIHVTVIDSFYFYVMLEVIT